MKRSIDVISTEVGGAVREGSKSLVDVIPTEVADVVCDLFLVCVRASISDFVSTLVFACFCS